MKISMSSNFLFKKVTYQLWRTATLFIILILAAGTAHIVLAHSGLARTEPEDGQVLSESPEEVRAWFSEELDSGSSMMLVFDSRNQQVDQADGGVDLNDMEHKTMVVSLLPALPEDIYMVHWTAASAEDGDLTEGDFHFTVGSPASAPEYGGQLPASSRMPVMLGIAAVLLLAAVVIFGITRQRKSSE